MSKTFKLFLCVIILIINSKETFAQSPDKINYQAVARNTTTGAELSNQEVYVVVKILAGDYNGEIVYQEDHQNIQTNHYGLFSLQIGNGAPISGSFSELNWESNSYWLEIDLDAGQGLKTLGTMEFVSVPYALHANTATHTDDADADPTNELVKDFLFDSDNRELTIVQEGENKRVGIGSINDADSDPYNEIIENWNFSEGILTFQEAGNNYSLDLNTLNIDDADADPTNELVKDFLFDENNRQLTIVQEGDNKTVDIGSIDDADSDPYNEIIENWNFSEGILTFQEAGNNYSLDLNSLNVDDADADPTNELVKDFLFDENNRQLTIVQEGDNKTVDIGSVDDADSDPYNEIIENWNFSEGILTFQEAGNNYSLDLNTLNIDDADADPTNELIDEGYPQLNDGKLDISEGGIMRSVDLKPLLSWDKDEDDIYILSKRVGIGTDSPTSQLTVRQTATGPSEILRVENDQSVAALSVEDGKVGLAGETGASHVQLHGSVGYSTKVLEAGANYTVQPNDYFIACRLLVNNDVHITMPDPSTCRGRVIYVRRANGAGGSNPKVHINWNGHSLNFSTGNTVLQDLILGVSINRIAVISLGDDGWAAID